MDELNPNEAAAESQEERDLENAIVPDLTDVVDLSEIPATEPEPQPHINGYSGPMTK